MSTSITFRKVAAGVLVAGALLGIVFGAGVAYGRGDPKTVQSGLTAQQLQSLLGISSAQAAAATSGQSAPGTNAGSGAAAGLLGGGATTGRITAIDGQTITIQTAQGSVKLNLAVSGTVSTVRTGETADLREGMSVVASGSRKDDGSFDATSITQLPSEIQALLTGGGRGGTSGR
jgi:hypothetical protein